MRRADREIVFGGGIVLLAVVLVAMPFEVSLVLLVAAKIAIAGAVLTRRRE